MASLVGSDGKRFAVGESLSVKIGRETDNDVIFNDDSVSRHHATLRSSKGHYFVHDLKSANGTFVSGNRILDAEISDGDRIRFGNVELVLRTEAWGPQFSGFCTKCGKPTPLQAYGGCPTCGARRENAHQINRVIRPSAPTYQEGQDNNAFSPGTLKMILAFLFLLPLFVAHLVARTQASKRAKRV